MTGVRWAAVLFGMVAAASPLAAQGVFIIYPPPSYGYLVGPVVGFGRGHGRLSFRPGYGPYGYSYTSTQVTVVLPPPAVAPLDQSDWEDLTLQRLRESLRNEPPPSNAAIQGEQHYGGFHKVGPPGGERRQPEPLNPPLPAPPAPPPAQPPAPPVKPPAPPAEPPGPQPELPMPPGPLNDADAEYARLLNRGRDAFADGEYGRAAQRFRQAVALRPNQALPQFLLSQMLFAQGKYHDAVDAIAAGLALQPDWPNAAFRPIELYGPHPADYADQLKALQDAVNRRPGDPDLLFLDAYMLWFDGRKDEARPLFQKALPGAADPGMVLRFLRAAAGPASL
ncbi:MAG TPA: tetratricopeptide repeat protein [Gemmataceae bacterium]|nr:tetratricopeptide repeat protein [Gemmataceae bacterium]